MEKALYIHGLHSDKDSSTGKIVKEIFAEHGIEVITDSFDVLDFDKTMKRIKEILNENQIGYIIGHSLGGYYAFLCGGKMILINPCLKPEEEIPKLLFEGEKVSPELKEKWINARENFLEDLELFDKQYINGIFAKNDELFTFGDYYSKECRLHNMQVIEGNHKVTKEQLSPAIEKIFEADFERYLRNPKCLRFPPIEKDEADMFVAYYNRSQNGDEKGCLEMKEFLEAKKIPAEKDAYRAWYIHWLETEFGK